MVKIGLIGPTNIKKLSVNIGKSADFLRSRADTIGKIVAKAGAELLVNSDKGMIMDTAVFYKKHGGKKLTILFPEKGEPWPNEHAKVFIKLADALKKEPNWFWTNYNVVSLPEICVCMGISAGTFCELAYIKWNIQFKKGNLKKLVVLKETTRGGKLPRELENEFKNVLVYLDKAEDLEKFLLKYQS